MKTWACVKNSKIVNIVSADESFMIKDPEISKNYDSYFDYESLEIPDIRIGSELVEGVWLNPADLSKRNSNYRGVIFPLNTTFKDIDLTGCNFLGADVSNCEFRAATGDFSLVGAVWNGQVIKHGPIFLPNKFYYCFMTDVFTVMSCVTMPTRDVAGMTPEEVSGSDLANPTEPALFWLEVKDDFMKKLSEWGIK